MRYYNTQTQQWEDFENEPGALVTKLRTGYIPEPMRDEKGAPYIGIIDSQGKPHRIDLSQGPQQLAEWANYDPKIRLATDWDRAIGKPMLPRGVEETATAAASMPGAEIILGPAGMALQGPGAIMSRAIGTASGLTMGTSDTILSFVAPDLLRAAQTFHPNAKMSSELGAAVGSAFLTGGAGAAAQTGKAPGVINAIRGFFGAGKAAATGAKLSRFEKLMALTPSALSMRAQEKVGAMVTDALLARKMTGPGGVAARMLVRAGAMGGMGGLDAGIRGLASGVAEENLGDPGHIGESIAAAVPGALASAGAGFGLGAAFGAGGSVLGDIWGKPAQKAAKAVTELATPSAPGEFSEMQVAARSMVDDELIKVGLKPGIVEDLHGEGGDYMAELMRMDLLPDGSAATKIVNGKPVDVNPLEFRQRVLRATKLAGERIGALRTAADAAADMKAPESFEVVVRAVNDVLEGEVKLAQARALKADTALDATTKAQLIAEVEGELAGARAIVDRSAWPTALDFDKGAVEVTNLPSALEKRVHGGRELPYSRAGDAERNTIWDNVRRYLFGAPKRAPASGELLEGAVKGERAIGQQPTKPPRLVWRYRDIQAEKTALRGFWERARNTDKFDTAAGHRSTWKLLDSKARERVAQFLGEPMAQEWDTAARQYAALATIGKELADAGVQSGAKLSFIQGLTRAGNQVGWRTSSTIAGSLRSMGRGAIFGGAAGMLGGVATGTGGALAGAGLVAAGKAMMPRGTTLARLGYDLAANQQLLQQSRAVGDAIDEAIRGWLASPTFTKVTAPLAGMAGWRVWGGDENPRKAAANLQGQVTSFTTDPQMWSMHLAMRVGPLMTTHPNIAQEYAQAATRQLMAIQEAFQGIPQPQLTGALQPGLQRAFESASDADLEKAAMKISAATDPAGTAREIFAGVATQQQVDTFRFVWPNLYAGMMRAMAMSAAERKEPFTDQQKYVLRQLGFTDWDMPVGYIGRAQALYQPQVQKQGDLPQGAYDKLSKLGDLHASKEVSRARQSQEV